MSDEIRMTNDELPEGWQSCALGDVVDYGKTQKAEPSEISAKSWILELEDIEKDTSRLLSRVTFAERKSKSTKNRFETGDVLYGKLRPYLNKVIIADQPGFCTTEIIPLQAKGTLENRYLFYWLKHPRFLDYVSAVSHGLNMPRLGTDAGKQAPFILAPLPEQKRIADKLDALLGRVDSCRARLDRVPALLKRFRQSVLAAATSGRLTEEWRAANGVNDEWEETELGDLVTEMKNGLVAKQTKEPVGVPMSRIETIADGTINPERIGYSTEVSLKQAKAFRLQVGDILFSHINSAAHLGKTAIYEGIPETLFHGMNLMLLRTDARRVTPQFLEFALQHLRGESVFSMVAQHAVNQASINQKKLRAILISIPTLPEQQEIVRRVEGLFALADRIEARLATAQKTVERLTPATLAKAFRGELVPQDPNDEPAIELLERLRNQPTSSPAKRTQRGRSKLEKSV